MALCDEKLKAIQLQLKQGVVPPKESVRSFLAWFYAERRGYNVVQNIRRELKRYSVSTHPDFETQYIDGYVGFVSAPVEADGGADGANGIDPTYRLARLDSAHRKPISVKPDWTLQQVVAVMMTNDFSQVPVMTTPTEVKGVVSWKSIGRRLALKKACTVARECMDAPEVMAMDESLFSAIVRVAKHDYTLVQAKNKEICGIVTASDLNDQFLRLAEPFLLVGEIENGIRRLLHGKFTAKELEQAKAPGDDERAVGAVSDLTFGEYIRLLEPPTAWKKLNLEIDRGEIISRLNAVRKIRNDVMHFDPDGIEPSDLASLKEFASFLMTLREIGAA